MSKNFIFSSSILGQNHLNKFYSVSSRAMNLADQRSSLLLSKTGTFSDLKAPQILHNDKLPCVFSYVKSSETRLMSRFINFLTKKGKKATAESVFSKTLYLLTKKASEELEKSSERHERHSNFEDIRSKLSSSENNNSSSIFVLFNQAISNVKPLFEVKKVRVAGTTYQVPALIQSNRQESLAINWLIQSASERKKKNPSQAFENCLAFEIYEAYQKQGQARNKRNELHKLAEANRAFSHFRWW